VISLPASGAPGAVATSGDARSPGHTGAADALPAGLVADASAWQQEAIPVSRPRLPGREQLVPYLDTIDASGWYTNFGPLHESLRRRLAGHLGLAEDRVGLAGSATVAISALILATAGRAGADRPLCVCPSFTFAATGLAIAGCGYTPLLADVDAASWALDPARVAAMEGFDRAALVVVVAPFGRAPDLAAWQDFADRTGRPVVIDAAACFDTLDAGLLGRLRLPVAVSLHATKTLSSAEGGLMLCGDVEVVRRAVAATNFGFDGTRESLGPGLNGKLSEYHAAIGLADLDGWSAKRAGFLRTARLYLAEAARLGLADRILADPAHATPYVHWLAGDGGEAMRLREGLAASGIGARLWYERGLHVQAAFADCPAEPLPTTEALAPRLLGLPCAVDLQAAEVAAVLEAIRRCLDRAG
jgi:dTDP-4-amino-4,6-dideoxygalactose transaminase